MDCAPGYNAGEVEKREREDGDALMDSRDMKADMNAADLKAAVEGSDGIFCIRASETCRGWNGIQYKLGMSEKNVGSRKLSMNVATIPPGAVAYAHIHVDFELMLYILEGNVRHEYGENLSQTIENKAGDFIYIEPGVPHEVTNLSDTEPVMAVVARSDASEWENIVPYEVPGRATAGGGSVASGDESSGG